jgi:hypothetical protein
MRKILLIALVSLRLGGGLWFQSLRKVGTIGLPGPKGQRFEFSIPIEIPPN